MLGKRPSDHRIFTAPTFDARSCSGYRSYWFDLAAGRQRRRWRLGNSDRLNLTSSSSRTSCMAFMSIDVTTLRRGTGVIIIYLSSCESFARRLRPCCSISSQRRIFILFFFFFTVTFLCPQTPGTRQPRDTRASWICTVSLAPPSHRRGLNVLLLIRTW